MTDAEKTCVMWSHVCERQISLRTMPKQSLFCKCSSTYALSSCMAAHQHTVIMQSRAPSQHTVYMCALGILQGDVFTHCFAQ